MAQVWNCIAEQWEGFLVIGHDEGAQPLSVTVIQHVCHRLSPAVHLVTFCLQVSLVYCRAFVSGKFFILYGKVRLRVNVGGNFMKTKAGECWKY